MGKCLPSTLEYKNQREEIYFGDLKAHITNDVKVLDESGFEIYQT